MRRQPHPSIIVSSRLFVLLGCAIVVAALGLRVASFRWNTRLQGDVNLYALTAREFAQQGRLYYPMKYEFSDNVPYRVLQSPATQHPPLYPFVAGTVARLSGTADTFTILKLMCEVVAGVLLLALLAAGWRSGWRAEALIAAAAVAVAPLLVDFSANGSPYILSTTLVLLSSLLLARFRYDRLWHYVLAAVICAVGLLAHGAMIGLVAAFGLAGLLHWREVRWRGVAVFGVVLLVGMSPWIAWNLLHFGTPLYSFSTYYVPIKLGMVREGIYGDVISLREVSGWNAAIVLRYARLIVRSTVVFLYHYLFEIGPFCAVLIFAGLWASVRTNWRTALVFVLPTALYAITIFLLPAYNTRYLLPVLPLSFGLAALGFTTLFRGGARRRAAALSLIVGTLLWGVPRYFQQPPTQYYLNDAQYAANYAKMRALAEELAREEPGVTLGYAGSLDGGLETIYWAGVPYVRGGGSNAEDSGSVAANDYQVRKLQKLAQDFDARYIWADAQTLPTIQRAFPDVQVKLQHDPYYVLEMPTH